MKTLPSFLLAAVGAALAAAPAEAQISISARLGRHGSVQVGFPAPCRIEPVRRVPVADDCIDFPVPHRRQHGRWETRCEQVLVPGYWREDHVPPSYGWVYDHCGHRHWRMVDPGGCRRVWVPERYETRHTRVWVPC